MILTEHISTLVGKKAVNEAGQVGDIIAYAKDCKHVLVRFYDGIDSDPGDPGYPMYTRVIHIDDLKLYEA